MKFRLDSPLMEFMNTTANFVGLNLVFLLTCIPIITIGPAIAALYQVLMREARGEHGYLVKSYFHYFKEMFLQGMLTFLLYIGIGLVVVYSFFFWRSFDGYAAIAVSVILAIIFIFLLCSMTYVFPLMARFQNTFKQTIKNANIMALVNGKYTFILLILHLFVNGMMWLFPAARIFMLLIGFAFCAYCFSFLYVKLFKNYEPQDNENTEITDKTTTENIEDDAEYSVSSI